MQKKAWNGFLVCIKPARQVTWGDSFSTSQFWTSQPWARLIQNWVKQAYIPCTYSHYMSDDWLFKTIHLEECTKVDHCVLIGVFFPFNFAPMWACQVYGSDRVIHSNSLKIKGRKIKLMGRQSWNQLLCMYVWLYIHMYEYVQYDILLIWTSVVSWCLQLHYIL